MFSDKDRAIYILKNGLLDNKKIKKAISTITKYYKWLKYDENTANDYIVDWMKKQECEIPFNVVIEMINNVVKSIYNHEYKFIESINVGYSENEVNCINQLRSKGDKIVAFSFIYLSKIYGEVFYCYHSMLHKLTGLSTRQIKRIINRLADCGFIEVVSKNKTQKILEIDKVVVKRFSKPNSYKVLIKSEGDIIFNVGDVDNLIDSFTRSFNY